MSVPSDGSYGIEEGIITSFPCTTSNGEYSIVQGLKINEFSQGKIDASVAELREEREPSASRPGRLSHVGGRAVVPSGRPAGTVRGTHPG